MRGGTPTRHRRVAWLGWEMEKVRAWVAQFIVDYMVVQVLSSAPVAYLAGWAFQWAPEPGRDTMGFDSLPALFWPILCVLLSLITGYHGWISPIVRKRGQWKEDLRKDVEVALTYVSQARRPESLNPKHTFNPAAIRQAAENAADVVYGRISKILRDPPNVINAEDQLSIEEWYATLRKVRRAIA